MNEPFQSVVALSIFQGCSEYERQLPSISTYLPHHQALISTLLRSEEKISIRQIDKQNIIRQPTTNSGNVIQHFCIIIIEEHYLNSKVTFKGL